MKKIAESNKFRKFVVFGLSCFGLLVVVLYGKEIFSYYFVSEAHVHSKGMHFFGGDALIMSIAFIVIGCLCFYAGFSYYKKWFGNK